jgi:GNAT superfamily N-acetyltransferase
MKVIIKTPNSCSRRDLNEFQRQVEKGDEVETSGLRERIRRAFLLAFAYIGDSIVGVAGLKNPCPSYKRKIFEKADLKQRCHEFDKELGWVFVVEGHRGRGISTRLVKALLKEAGGFNIFATSRIEIVPMHRALMSAGFLEAGKSFISGRGNKVKLFLNFSPPSEAQCRSLD